MMNHRKGHRAACRFSCLVASLGRVQSGTLQVTVVDARDRQPIAGAFVMVGPGKESRFPGTPRTPADRYDHLPASGDRRSTDGYRGRSDLRLLGRDRCGRDAIQIPLYPLAPRHDDLRARGAGHRAGDEHLDRHQ